ncbi:unnamed protein product [Pleuronectes platessa]|uniref:Uncharacterized protein n=1 Tax=Pleuronectes platessa TaxID=8262 RepID=A0A9N7YX56_PLEPL|nr:unnamed protein product [Pleuronectes platessa]
MQRLLSSQRYSLLTSDSFPPDDVEPVWKKAGGKTKALSGAEERKSYGSDVRKPDTCAEHVVLREVSCFKMTRRGFEKKGGRESRGPSASFVFRNEVKAQGEKRAAHENMSFNAETRGLSQCTHTIFNAVQGAGGKETESERCRRKKSSTSLPGNELLLRDLSGLSVCSHS